VIPHLTQDVVRGHTPNNGIYVGLEDCKLIRGP
jgi:hypothetical protein